MENFEIKRNRPEAHDCNDFNYYEWIPWERLSNINKIGEGGLGTIYKATLIDGLIATPTIEHHGKMKCKKNEEGTKVAIKFTSLKNSEKVLKELNTQRTIFFKNGYISLNISKIIGITKNAETLKYGIVMKFAPHGDIRKHFSTNFYSTDWGYKLSIACSIVSGLIAIHSAGMVHRDLHSGNILQYSLESSNDWISICGLGLCHPSNNEAKAVEKKMYGVIPYIPPEVLSGKKFTKKGDIYSFAMILWELATGMPPFHDHSHDKNLITAILNGKRPEITSPLIPPCYAELIGKCWDDSPWNRPTLKELEKKLMEFKNLYYNGSTTERLLFQESEKYIKESNAEDGGDKDHETIKASKRITIHSEAVYTSRLLTAQMVEGSNELIYSPGGTNPEKELPT
ncbi:hypothetical protein G9A89_009773 [Geosiphon pyriformis]|nr:hypothetical protein G9A89_009773 [Geosiphon pyriformis]